MNTTFTIRESNAGALLLTMTAEGEKAMLLTWDPAGMADYLLMLRDGSSMQDVLDSASDSDILSAEDMAATNEEEFGKVIADANGYYDCGVAGEDLINRVGLTENPVSALYECLTADEIVDLVEKYSDIISDVADVRYLAQKKAIRRRVSAICRIIWNLSEDSTYSALTDLVAAWERVCVALLGDASLNLTPYREKDEDELEECSFEDADRVEFDCWNVFDPLAEDLRDMLNGSVIRFDDCEWCDDSVTYYFKKA
jgi:hypothetical protein